MKKFKPCKHACISPDKRGRFIMRADKPYRCAIPGDVIPQPPLPASITRSHSFRWPPAISSYVGKDDCARCPFHTPREDDANG